MTTTRPNGSLRTRAFRSAAAAIAVVLPACSTAQDDTVGRARALPARPNILFVMADDHAAHALSCYGSRVNVTPNLDRLARGGARFERAFVTNSICTPSRATLLTGQYSHRNGVPMFNRLDPARPTVAKTLQAAGYHTGLIGKWHLGGEPQGFERWTMLPGQGAYVDPVVVEAAGRRVVPGHVTDVLTEQALAFLAERPADRPFFLMLHHKAPHREWTPAERHRALFAGQELPEPDTLFDDYATRADALRENRQTIARDLRPTDLKLPPPPGLSGDELTRWKYQRYMQDYLACVQGVDDSVGRVLDWLDAHGLAETTVVFYTSDNGFFLGEHGLYDKRLVYEESIRVPLLARWSGVLPAEQVVAPMVLNVDLAETFLELAGLPIPGDMQGRSLVPLLRGERPADWRRSLYYRYYHDPGDHDTRAHLAVRTETHKLVHYWRKDQWELFDLVHDPRELRNLHGDPAHAALVEELRRELERLKRELGDHDQLADEQLPYAVD